VVKILTEQSFASLCSYVHENTADVITVGKASLIKKRHYGKIGAGGTVAVDNTLQNPSSLFFH
jgi:hypothetical protein